MSNISKTVTDTTMGQWKPNIKPTLELSVDTMTFDFDDLELSYFKVIKITGQIFQKR